MEVDIHAGDQFPESVRPDIRTYCGIDRLLRWLRFKKQSLKNRHRSTSREAAGSKIFPGLAGD
jgi:hypothetical protein